jgi:hypothetical protein
MNRALRRSLAIIFILKCNNATGLSLPLLVDLGNAQEKLIG